MSYLDYTFFQNALLGVLLISISAGIIGTYIISRRLVAICGGVTHACFGGLGLGYWLGISPVAMAAVVAVLSSAGVEWSSTRFKLRQDSAIAVIWGLGMALGVLFVFMTPGYVPELTSFLFGNILTIGTADLWMFGGFAALLVGLFACVHRYIIICAFDHDFARVSGLPVKLVSYTMTVMVALCIVLTIRLVGVMLLMSMLSLPIMTAELFSRRFMGTMGWSVLLCVLCGVAGLFLSTLIDVPCSALIVLLMAGVYFMTYGIKTITRTSETG